MTIYVIHVLNIHYPLQYTQKGESLCLKSKQDQCELLYENVQCELQLKRPSITCMTRCDLPFSMYGKVRIILMYDDYYDGLNLFTQHG